MTIHYHGTPITPTSALYDLAGRHFCVSFYHPRQVARVHEIGQSVMLDNGAFSAYRSGKPVRDWKPYYAWSDRWLQHPTTWAVIPDEIDAGAQAQDDLLRQWPHGERGAPVWHMDEPVERLARLSEAWPRVCIGSSGQFWQVLSDAWILRMDAAWSELMRHHRRVPWIHMLRGMQLTKRGRWPFASVDSTDVARSHHRPHNTPRGLADRWDAAQCPLLTPGAPPGPPPVIEPRPVAGASIPRASNTRATLYRHVAMSSGAVLHVSSRQYGNSPGPHPRDRPSGGTEARPGR